MKRNTKSIVMMGIQFYTNLIILKQWFTIVKKKYIISIIELDEILYWHLEPYNGSVFNTRIDATGEKLKMVLFAIKENEELYSKKGNGTNETNQETT